MMIPIHMIMILNYQFSLLYNGYQATEVAKIFWILVPVCHVQPRGIIRNATFIVDVDDVNFSDFKADDLGSWVTKGTKPLSFDFSLMDQYVYLPESLLFKKDHHTRRYYTHATYRLFR